MDKIIIRDLEVDTIVGIFDHERVERQNILINAIIGLNLEKVGKSDDFKDALNYSDVEEILYNTAKNSEYFLVEKLANVLADKILEMNLVEEVTILVDKPKAAQYAKSIAIEINRKKI